MLAAIEKVLIEEKPDWVLIYGDTNSTLAGALAAAKLHIPIAHVEAGLRSFNRRMPEEINRVVADQLSTLLLCPSQVAVDNLAAEGIGGKGDRMSAVIDEPPPALRATSAGGGQKESSPVNLEQSSNIEHRTLNIEHSSPVEPRTLNIEQATSVVITGDVMADALQFAATKAAAQSDIVERLDLKPQGYILATVHRAENTDDPKRLSNIMAALSELAEREPVILPLHPRTKKILERTSNLEHRTLNVEPRTLNIEQSSSVEPRTLNIEPRTLNIERPSSLRIINPVGYFDIIALEKSARILLTDSGGMQKEAYWLKVPCITLRDETEWVETVASGWNILTGADRNRIVTAVRSFKPPSDHPPLYGDGQAAEKILSILCQNL
jgi:UDP-N-acetylglucosamine 2-epimerase